jgi:uncharacterized LabA/DUF88 family protein
LNLHHSLREAQAVAGRPLLHLDVLAFCTSYLHALPGRSTLCDVFYFSALPHHLESRHPGEVARQVRYFSAIESTGVHVRLGHFKSTTMRCPLCRGSFARWEEKETDVAIGAKLIELVCRRACDTTVLVSGDTDLVPAIHSARGLDSGTRLGVVLPYRRGNAALKSVADFAFSARVASYARHQLATSA